MNRVLAKEGLSGMVRAAQQPGVRYMTYRFLSIVTTALLFGGQLYSQSHPDFTGTWVIEASRGERDATTPSTLVIVQSADKLTVESRTDGQASQVTYSFKSPSGVAAPAGQPDETAMREATAKWEGEQLETSAVMSINGRTVTQTGLWTLDPAGSKMTVKKDLMVHHGYEQMQAHGSATEIYLKNAAVSRQ
jgi:hypothetical protein